MRDEENIAVGERLRYLREAHGLTQTAIGRQVGASMNRWNNWERGVGRIPVDASAQLVRMYGVTLDWIYLGREEGMRYDLIVKFRAIEAAKGGG